MPHACQYCDTVFSNRKNMLAHQKTAKYCRIIQQEKGVQFDEFSNKCECGEIFTRKDNYKRHQLKCLIKNEQKESSNQPINITNNNLNQINIAIYGSTATSLTPEYLQTNIVPLLVDAVKGGVEKLTEMAVQTALTNEKGNPLAIVTDPSRGKLMIRYDNGDEPDVQGAKTTQIISGPMKRATMLSINNGDTDAGDTLKDINLLDTDNSKALSVLVKTLPRSFDKPIDPKRAELERLYEEDKKVTDEMVKKALKFCESENHRKEKLRAADALDKLLEDKNFMSKQNGIFWHNEHQFCFRVTDKTLRSSKGEILKRINLFGRSSSCEGEINNFTAKDLKIIENLKLSYFLDQRYKPQKN